MRARVAAIGLMCGAVLCAGDKKVPLRSTENALVEVTATALADREAVKQELGSDLGGHYIVVTVLGSVPGSKAARSLIDAVEIPPLVLGY